MNILWFLLRTPHPVRYDLRWWFWCHMEKKPAGWHRSFWSEDKRRQNAYETHMAASVCVTCWEQHWDGDYWILLLIIQNKCSLKKVPSTQHVLISNIRPRVRCKERKILTPDPSRPVLLWELHNCFYKTTTGRKDKSHRLQTQCFSPSVGDDGFLKNWQNHGGAVESSSACFVHPLMYLYLLCFQTPWAQRNKVTVFHLLFTYRYVVSNIAYNVFKVILVLAMDVVETVGRVRALPSWLHRYDTSQQLCSSNIIWSSFSINYHGHVSKSLT